MCIYAICMHVSMSEYSHTHIYARIYIFALKCIDINVYMCYVYLFVNFVTSISVCMHLSM